jgi:hypothetical protein
MSAIDDLVTAVQALAIRPVARNKKEAEKWLSDFEAYTRARTRNVQPIPDQLRPLIDRALDEWQGRENEFLNAIRSTRSEFLAEASRLIRKFTPKSRQAPNLDIILIGEAAERRPTVRNIDWVHTFAWILPKGDAKNAASYRIVGETMATIMCCEAMLKWPEAVETYKILRSLAQNTTVANYQP